MKHWECCRHHHHHHHHHHVPELHLLVCGESAVVVAGDQRLELSRLQVGNLQNLVGVREAII